MSPEELRKRAKRAAMVAEVRAVLRERRLKRLAAHPQVQAGIQRMAQRARDRIRERAEQEAAARRAEAAALEAAAAAAAAAAATVAPVAVTPGGAPTVAVLEQRLRAREAQLTPQAEHSLVQVWWGAAGDVTQPQAAFVLRTCWLVSSACYYGTTELQRLQAVWDQLSAHQAAGFGAGLCPVCKDTTQDTWDSWGQQLQPQQPGAGAAEPKGQLSVGAAEYVPHAQRGSHQDSVKAFNVSCCARSACHTGLSSVAADSGCTENTGIIYQTHLQLAAGPHPQHSHTPGVPAADWRVAAAAAAGVRDLCGAAGPAAALCGRSG